jgi:hypothetical protein
MESHGTLQNPAELHEIPWKILEHGGIFRLLTNDYKRSQMMTSLNVSRTFQEPAVCP